MSGIREPSDYTLGSWEKCFKQQIHSAMSPISPGTLLEWIDEIRRLRAENAKLKKKVALLKSDKRDLIEEIDGPVTESW